MPRSTLEMPLLQHEGSPVALCVRRPGLPAPPETRIPYMEAPAPWGGGASKTPHGEPTTAALPHLSPYPQPLFVD